jgi:hypothetical protein
MTNNQITRTTFASAEICPNDRMANGNDVKETAALNIEMLLL